MDRTAQGRRIGALAHTLRVVSWAALAAGVASPALAQQSPQKQAPTHPSSEVAPKTTEGVQTFDAGFFKTYNPVTAADMVARVPGFEVRDGDDRRGFAGTAGNVLINGERPSSKTIASEQLKRIPADSVARIELISGSATSEVSGQSQLVNIVLKKAQAKGSPTTFVLAARHIQYSNRIGWTTQASRAFALGDNAELSIDLQASNLRGRGDIFEAQRDGAGNLTAYRDQHSQPNNIGLQGSGTLKWRPDAADSVNINLQFAPTWNTTNTSSFEHAPSGAFRSVLSAQTKIDDNYTGELGADWEHRFSPTFSTKLIGLINVNNAIQHDIFNTTSYTASPSNIRTQDRDTNGGERVGRLTATWRASKDHTVEFGGEGAFNFRETHLDIFSQVPPGSTPVRVPLAVSNARVEEVRGEAFVTDVWTVNKQLTLETGFTYEASRITQTGDQAKEREFSYPKPRVTATWAMDKQSTVRASLQRDVAQLDFAEFSSTVDFVNANSTTGNPNLVPEKAWKSRIEWETHFAKRGAFTIAAFYDKVEDVHDFVEVAERNALGVVTSYSDGYGNIGDGSRTGVEIKAALPLAMIGLPTAELRFNGLYQNTEVTDPKTGQKRSFSITPERQGSPSGSPTLNAGNKDWAYVVNFRQEVPSLKSAWGSALVQWSGRGEYKRAETLTYERKTPRLDLYWETTAVQPVTIRVNVNNIFSANDERVRTFYGTDRALGVITRQDTRKSKGGPEGSRSFGVQVSGKF
jgi:hypothetical protein